MKRIMKTMAVVLMGIGMPVAAVAQGVVSPCPQVLIMQKYDHVVNPRYRAEGWDTAVTCTQHQLELAAEPYIPVQFFNGTYIVQEVDYNPPDTTFYMGGNGTQLNISGDDIFAPSSTTIAFPFYFFGIKKTSFRLGDNGMVTFNGQNMSGNRCPYSFTTSNTLPWTQSANNTPEGNSYFDRMHDAIYGVYEDSHPYVGGITGNQGIYYGVMGDFPCRKIMACWNEIPLYGYQDNNRQTYQIVCYEGSNIIEVHIKRRGCCSSTNGGVGLLGIQNATGEPQQPSTVVGAPNYFVESGAPAAFWPDGWNLKNVSSGTTVTNTAYRFTPQGETFSSYTWYKLVEGADSIPLTTDPSDTNGYYIPMDIDPDHPTLTKAYVSPTRPTRYVMQLRFQNAEGDWYDLRDTIFVGVDTVKTLQLLANDGQRTSGTNRVFDVCQGQTVECPLKYTSIQSVADVQWTIKRTLNGLSMPISDSVYSISGERDTILTLLPDPGFDTMPTNKIDTVQLLATVLFASGCTNYDTIMIRTFPNFDTTEVYGICRGDDFVWHVDGQRYTESTKSPEVNLHSSPGCDSVVHLDLTVFDVSHTTDYRNDCKPIRWLNGKTYYEDNTATRDADTIVMPNRFGCDSVVQLDFTIHPLTARLRSDIEYFDYDNLVANLYDVSTGNNARQWIFPNGVTFQSQQVMYSLPFGLDEADITMIAYSPYGCMDTAYITIPFNKETFWMPNAFTPDDPNGNNYFGSVSSNAKQQEMYIYNRMGVLVFYGEGVDVKWDGKDMNGNPCPQGAYAYIIRYTDVFKPQETKTRKGTVTLIR